jgi:hypothetical protein
MRTSADVLRALEALTPEQRTRVEKIVRDHVRACYRNGFQPESMDRVFIEAIEVERLEAREPRATAVKRDFEPARRYTQYVAPKSEAA